jgi:hypothetical protein
VYIDSRRTAGGLDQLFWIGKVTDTAHRAIEPLELLLTKPLVMTAYGMGLYSTVEAPRLEILSILVTHD